jgi:hypothetical protein
MNLEELTLGPACSSTGKTSRILSYTRQHGACYNICEFSSLEGLYVPRGPPGWGLDTTLKTLLVERIIVNEIQRSQKENQICQNFLRKAMSKKSAALPTRTIIYPRKVKQISQIPCYYNLIFCGGEITFGSCIKHVMHVK